jgi:DNA polymerase (family 10)
MTNKDIARAFRDLAEIMELHEENTFKIRSYQNAYMALRKVDQPLTELSLAELAAMKGVGKAISEKIRELIDTGQMATLEKYRAQTPPGVVEMLGISGFGPKKVRTVWQDLGVETIGELQYALNENRLLELKGFGLKTQEDLKEKLAYYQRSRNQFLYAVLEPDALTLDQQLRDWLPADTPLSFTGAFRRQAPVLEAIEWLVGDVDALARLPESGLLTAVQTADQQLRGLSPNGYPVVVYGCTAAEFGSKLFRYTGSADYLAAFVARYAGQDFRGLPHEDEVFRQVGAPTLPPQLREGDAWLGSARPEGWIEESQVRGLIHCHTTYSDGLHSLAEMAAHARALGFAYIGVTDHSKSAFYANGLQEERVWQQMREIDDLNAQAADGFVILKGIESDILADGSLDYPPDVLAAFDFIIASVHANLRMDEDKATRRLIGAIENPYTAILGHPTGRLLLSRPGYPIDHRKVIDACAANGVAIELNASPYRLDLDYAWIHYAQERGVLVSINPDAHSREGMRDLRYGVMAARKGGLTAEGCLNARPNAAEFLAALKRQA